MRKLFFLFLFFILINECLPQNGWVRQLAETQSLRDVIFVNENTGWTFGNNIMKTSNGGINWVTQISLFSSGNYGSCGAFVNENTGWICTFPLNGTYYNIDLKIMKTTNGGENWTQMPVVRQTFYPTSIFAINENQFYITTSFYLVNPILGGGTYFGNILKTTNGGVSYSEQRYNNSLNYSYAKVKFLNEYTGFASIVFDSTNKPDILKTTNGGVNWNSLGIFNELKTIGQFQFLNENTGYIYGSYNLGSAVFRTSNSGTSWQQVVMHDSINDGTRGFYFSNAQTGWICGRNFSIAKTEDGGVNWIYNRVYPPIYGSIGKIQFINNFTGWFFGNNGSEDVIYKTTNGGVTYTNEISSEVPDTFYLSQNYPNPFNPSTVISWQLPVAGFVQIKIYDATGNEVEILVNEKKSAGSYSVTFNAASRPSGIYFYKLVTDKFSETRKMILIK